MTRSFHKYLRYGLIAIPVVMVSAWLLLKLAAGWLPARVALVHLYAGSSKHCSWSHTVDSYRFREDGEAAFKVLKNQRRLLKTEGPLQFWDAGDGLELWAPKRGEFYVGGPPGVRWVEIRRESPVKKGDIFIDCGGYIGGSAAKALELGAQLVVTIEPDPDNLECIRRNLASEIEEGRVIVYPKGVWDRPDQLFLKKNLVASDGTVNESEGVPIELTTIDLIVEELDLPRVDVIKMDIEGAEQKALQGAAETLRKFRPRLALASYHLPDDLERIPAVVNEVRSDYQLDYERCYYKHGKVIPHLLYFH